MTGMNYSVIENCVQQQGPQLLQSSINKISNTNESISCTINLNGVFWCQHNGDWVGCDQGNTSNDLVTSICALYSGPNQPEICWNLEQRAELLTAG